jgi:hypothetical protein
MDTAVVMDADVVVLLDEPVLVSVAVRARGIMFWLLYVLLMLVA